MKKLIMAAAVAAGLAAAAQAQAPVALEYRLAGAGYSDPAFQDFVETAYGYLNPRNAPAEARPLRDAVASPATAAAATEYVFVSILPRTTDHAALVAELGAKTGFRLKGERTSAGNGLRQTRLLGWVKVSALKTLRGNPGVAYVRVGGRARGTL